MGKFFLREYWDSFRISRPSKLGWVGSSFYSRNLGRRECDYFMIGRVPEDHVEVMEIPAGCSNYDHSFHVNSLWRRFALRELYNLVHHGAESLVTRTRIRGFPTQSLLFDRRIRECSRRIL